MNRLFGCPVGIAIVMAAMFSLNTDTVGQRLRRWGMPVHHVLLLDAVEASIGLRMVGLISTEIAMTDRQDGLMAYLDGSQREMAKWAHQRLDAARRRGEDEQRHALGDLTNHPVAQADNDRGW